MNYLFTIVIDKENSPNYYRLESQYKVIAPNLEKALVAIRETINKENRPYSVIEFVKSATRTLNFETGAIVYRER